MSSTSYRILRYAMAVLFLWFGVQQVMRPVDWQAFLPDWIFTMPVSPIVFVRANGVFEIVFGGALALGLYTRVAAAVLAFHLGIIAVSVGSNIGARDAALTAAVAAIAFTRPDSWTLDRFLKR